MSQRSRTVIASSIEPSGVTWLLNCLMHLDILCYRDGSPSNTWFILNGEFSLRPEHEELKRWLPITAERTSFKFSTPVECEWTHNLPSDCSISDKVILFVRDPRGSILSRYKRDFSDISIYEFIRLLNSRSLLTVPDYLNLFYQSWLDQPHVLILKFEDYKQNPLATLKMATSFLELDSTDEDLALACSNSSFEKAAEAEKKYIEAFGLPKERMMNRAGSTREWIDDEKLNSVREVIESSCHQSLISLNYSEIFPETVTTNNDFSRSFLESIKVGDVIFQRFYSKQEKLEILHSISKSNLLGTRRRLTFTVIFFVLNKWASLDEFIKISYLRVKSVLIE